MLAFERHNFYLFEVGLLRLESGAEALLLENPVSLSLTLSPCGPQLASLVAAVAACTGVRLRKQQVCSSCCVVMSMRHTERALTPSPLNPNPKLHRRVQARLHRQIGEIV